MANCTFQFFKGGLRDSTGPSFSLLAIHSQGTALAEDGGTQRGTVLLQVPLAGHAPTSPPAPHRALPLEGPTPASEPSCVERAFLIGALSQGRRRPSRPCAPRPASPAPPARSYPEARSCRGARQGKPGSVRDLGPALPRTREAAAPGTGAGMEGGAWLGLGARPAGLWVWVGAVRLGDRGVGKAGLLMEAGGVGRPRGYNGIGWFRGPRR